MLDHMSNIDTKNVHKKEKNMLFCNFNLIKNFKMKYSKK